MNDYVNIIKSNIIPAHYDGFWDDISPVISGTTPREVLVIANEYPDNGTEELQLKKMLEACKLQPAQYNIIRLKEGQQAAWRQLSEKLNPQVVFLIGILPVQLGISSLFKINEPNHFSGRVFLPTVSLDELEQNAEMKKQLWQKGMKPIFVDKLFTSQIIPQ